MGAPAAGFLKLDTRFPRIAGDAGCAATWPFPALYHTVEDAVPHRVVRERAEGLLPAFVAGGKQLAEQGAACISTTCGFLCLHQEELARALPVPVLTSALLSGRDIQRALPAAKKLGILTASSADLSDAHLRAAGIIPDRAVIGGLAEDSAFADTILNDRSHLDVEGARRDMRAAALDLCARADVGAMLLECANMPPYADAVAEATGVKVYSLVDSVIDLYQRVTLSAAAQ